MTDRSNFGPSVPLARLYECTSKQGRKYYRGRMGMANVVLLASDEVSDSGQPIWRLKISEASPSKYVKQEAVSREVDRDQEPVPALDSRLQEDWRGDMPSDRIPF